MVTAPPLHFSTDFDPDHGACVPLVDGIARIVAPNASPYTFTGTNSYLLGREHLVLVDPGPERTDHLDALVRAVDGRPVTAIVLTHTHRDHSGLARAARARFAAPIWSSGPHRLFRPLARFEINPFDRAGDFTLEPDRRLDEGDRIETDSGSWTVVPTPGHCANHIALAQHNGSTLIVGDHVMGWNSTLVAAPDGELEAYLASLARLIALPHDLYLPGHGDVIADGPEMARALDAHRRMRNDQILHAAARGARTLSALMRAIYPELRGGRALAARQTLLAHLEYLQAQGDLALRRWPWGVRFSLAPQSPV